MAGNVQSSLANALFPAIMRSAIEIMQRFNVQTDVEIKADGSPVTAADRIAEEIILEALAEIEPGVPVIAEERSSSGASARCGDLFFLVDPLDGTREFAARRPEFTINVALVRDSKPVFGLIYAPAMSQFYVTGEAGEAYFAKIDAQAGCANFDPSRMQRLQTRNPFNAGRTIVASRSHGSEELEKWLQDVEVAERTNIGSSLKFCLVAEGKADLYPRFGPTKEWDTAAGHAIVTAAGGLVTRIDGQPFLYGKDGEDFLNPSFIVWGQPDMHELQRLLVAAS